MRGEVRDFRPPGALWSLEPFDCADPHRMARFWAATVGYEKEDHEAATVAVDGGVQFADVSACRDPDGAGPRLFFQKVPEGKAGKNRLHLDLHVAADRHEAEVGRLEALGASINAPRRRPTMTTV